MQSFYHYELLIEHADATTTVRGLTYTEAYTVRDLMTKLLHNDVVAVALRRIETGEILLTLRQEDTTATEVMA